MLFTDIEGSSKLLHEIGAEGYGEALAEHRRVLREAFHRHGGVEVDTQGDAFFIAFPTAPGALQAAQEAQQALAEGAIRVRMGLHTGTPHLVDEGYVGSDVHKAARIAAAGHGGQVLLSKETREMTEADVEVIDLGEQRVKDFDAPVWIFQLGSERFPPLKTISNTNLPRPASSFVGREREVSEIASLLRHEARLVTLTGPGGTGKTRLAIETAYELVPEHRNGVFWVDLAALRDPALVLGTIGQTLGAKDGLAEHIAEREMLLLLDNLEQVVEAAPELAALVERCPNLRLLATSRERLRIRGEVEYQVLPLAESDAVELFSARARADPDETIRALCRALDNLPLALELAAARASVLSPQQVLDRLARRLDLLKGGRDADADSKPSGRRSPGATSSSRQTSSASSRALRSSAAAAPSRLPRRSSRPTSTSFSRLSTRASSASRMSGIRCSRRSGTSRPSDSRHGARPKSCGGDMPSTSLPSRRRPSPTCRPTSASGSTGWKSSTTICAPPSIASSPPARPSVPCVWRDLCRCSGW